MVMGGKCKWGVRIQTEEGEATYGGAPPSSLSSRKGFRKEISLNSYTQEFIPGKIAIGLGTKRSILFRFVSIRIWQNENTVEDHFTEQLELMVKVDPWVKGVKDGCQNF
eukprot:Gb_00483 [translate_table: standard]